jgi:hypothetical protein
MKAEMNIIYDPDLHDKNEDEGPVLKFFKKLRNEHPPKLWVLVKSTLEKVENSMDMETLERQGWVRKITYQNVPLFEFRIPPQRRGGVARLYFAYKKQSIDTICILSVEKKQGRTQASNEKIKQACKRYKEVCL